MFFHLEILTSPVTSDNDDIIGDSEDEATKNFKGRVRIDPVEVTLDYRDAPLVLPSCSVGYIVTKHFASEDHKKK